MIDLSHPITDRMMVYPGDPHVAVRPGLTVPRDGVAVAAIEMGSHTGTHVDAPAHTVAGGATLDRFSLDELSGEALVLDAAARARDRRPLESADLGIEGLAAVPPIVFVRTGWDGCFGTDRYLAHPFLAPEAAVRLRDLGMRVLGVDALSPDPTAPGGGDGAADHGFPVHGIVLGGGGLIVENLRGLERLGRRAEVGIFPLPLAGADGAPARVVAWA